MAQQVLLDQQPCIPATANHSQPEPSTSGSDINPERPRGYNVNNDPSICYVVCDRECILLRLSEKEIGCYENPAFPASDIDCACLVFLRRGCDRRGCDWRRCDWDDGRLPRAPAGAFRNNRATAGRAGPRTPPAPTPIQSFPPSFLHPQLPSPSAAP